jgi:bifunctional UDP-N-acetylglucosamine pyrophosphorylase/glucosamine-1-phosphate N-acetyltransferase
MRTALILAAGQGAKLWPYATIRPKAMTPVCARPLIAHTVEALCAAGIQRIVIGAGGWASQIRGCFLGDERVTVVEVGETQGSAETLLRLRDRVADEAFLTLYGDVLLAPEALAAFVRRAQERAPLVLAAPLPPDSQGERLCLRLDGDGCVAEVLGHPRDPLGHWFAGFALTPEIFAHLEANPGYFRHVEVGMMSPLESFLEMSVAELALRQPVPALVCAADQALDVDRPWDILAANRALAARRCAALTGHRLAEGAFIDPSAQINGWVELGPNSHIGRHVLVEGNCIVGADTVIENGAILKGDNVIGDRCRLRNYCYLDEGAVVGHDCVLDHCAEFGGVLFDGVYLYHYMEMYGVIGEHTDIGAGTACGTLRFDDGETMITVRGRRERPRYYANAAYLGDFCRTGVNVTILPGKRIGCYSVIGAGATVEQDVPERTLLYVRQELVEKSWGPEKYGW